jgi:hypothetical protein
MQRQLPLEEQRQLLLEEWRQPLRDRATEGSSPMAQGRSGLGRAEIAMDTLQVLTETTATHIGRIASILSSAVRDVAREIGDLASDVFEMREAAERADRASRDDQPAP